MAARAASLDLDQGALAAALQAWNQLLAEGSAWLSRPAAVLGPDALALPAVVLGPDVQELPEAAPTDAPVA